MGARGGTGDWPPAHGHDPGYPPQGPLAAAASHGTATFQQTYSADSEFMVRTLHPGRLVRALAPALERRLRAALPVFQGTLLLETDLGRVALHVAPGRLDKALSLVLHWRT